jgi:hypothetical protein
VSEGGLELSDKWWQLVPTNGAWSHDQGRWPQAPVRRTSAGDGLCLDIRDQLVTNACGSTISTAISRALVQMCRAHLPCKHVRAGCRRIRPDRNTRWRGGRGSRRLPAILGGRAMDARGHAYRAVRWYENGTRHASIRFRRFTRCAHGSGGLPAVVANCLIDSVRSGSPAALPTVSPQWVGARRARRPNDLDSTRPAQTPTTEDGSGHEGRAVSGSLSVVRACGGRPRVSYGGTQARRARGDAGLVTRVGGAFGVSA